MPEFVAGYLVQTDHDHSLVVDPSQERNALDKIMNPNDFWTVMDIWVKDPQYVVPPILRADILVQECLDITQAINTPDWMSRECRERRLIKRWIRRLIPRQQNKDPIVYQLIEWFEYMHQNECVCLEAYHALITWKDATTYEMGVPIQEIPYYYPKVHSFSYLYQLESSAMARVSLIYDPMPIHQDITRIKSPQQHMDYIWQRLLKRLIKFGHGVATGYKKRVHHDQLVNKVAFQDTYHRLKEKYARYWVEHWTEETDPSKHVFEDLAIATFLIVLWDKEKPRFVDVGCGNGFLVYILTSEGYSGYGVDVSKRKLWDALITACPTLDLRECVLYPHETCFTDIDWMIGNHPDELTLWIPIMSAKSGWNTKFIIIPCCFHELSGAKYAHNNTKLGRYQSYIECVQDMMATCGYTCEQEYLRIPSTKNLALVGRRRIEERRQEEIIDTIDGIIRPITFIPRVSDQEKERRRHAKHA